MVSILTTVYNREEYLADCIESVLTQYFEDWELIIVDDCSSDGSVLIAEQYAQKSSRIKLYVNDKNLGQFENRNRAASLSSAEYIKFLDSDDLIYPHGLSVMMWAIEKYPEAGMAVSCVKADKFQHYPILVLPQQSYREQFIGKGFLNVGPSGVIFNRRVFDEVGGYKEDGYVGNDVELHYRVAAKYPVVKMPDSLVWWRQHNQQAYYNGMVENEYFLKHHRIVMETLNSNRSPLDAGCREIAILKEKQHFSRQILSMAIKSRKFGNAKKAFLNSDISIADLFSGLKKYR